MRLSGNPTTLAAELEERGEEEEEGEIEEVDEKEEGEVEEIEGDGVWT